MDEREPLLQFFDLHHSDDATRALMEPFRDLARLVVAMTPRNTERTVAVRYILQAADSALRARLYR